MDKHYLKRIIVLFMILSALYACQNYGRVLYESSAYYHSDDSKMTISKLMENWGDYHIYYYGTGIAGVDGVMFDPIHDENSLTGDFWKKINNEEDFKTLMDWIIGGDPSGNRLYKISGPGGDLFGYIYAPNEYMMPVAKMIDAHTLFVYPMRKYERIFNLI